MRAQPRGKACRPNSLGESARQPASALRGPLRASKTPSARRTRAWGACRHLAMLWEDAGQQRLSRAVHQASVGRAEGLRTSQDNQGTGDLAKNGIDPEYTREAAKTSTGVSTRRPSRQAGRSAGTAAAHRTLQLFLTSQKFPGLQDACRQLPAHLSREAGRTVTQEGLALRARGLLVAWRAVFFSRKSGQFPLVCVCLAGDSHMSVPEPNTGHEKETGLVCLTRTVCAGISS